MSRAVSPQNSLEIALENLGAKVSGDISAARHTTLAVGGPLRRFIEVPDEQVLANCLSILHREGEPFRALGFGSNLLVSDEGIEDWVVKLGSGFRYVEPLGNSIYAIGASMSLMSLSRNLSNEGYSGLEFAAGIPASFGGAVKMNAGAHGGEVSHLIEEVMVLRVNGEREVLSKSDLSFAYRSSSIADDSIVISAKIKVAQGDKEQVSALMRANLDHRRKTQPLQLPSAGSVFKNPSEEHSAGWLIEACDLKGHQLGGAQVSSLHGNWIVNPERRASSEEVLDLIRLCQEKVQEKFGLELEPEVKRWL